ncbi:hypothetical protein PGB34_01425 [Xenophilus arseniciresistens]|uniref:Uncharacterized protein n=1 Tax=Xenophilus arseniciresistens TaxID=1283306 RepID=A0AAE3N501_9BURK|nr:hypothetical protein [Xenophilus arseniciresistens]MDA7415013.1 hypothetical protein [Xenophilus arseniciresistens]
MPTEDSSQGGWRAAGAIAHGNYLGPGWTGGAWGGKFNVAPADKQDLMGFSHDYAYGKAKSVYDTIDADRKLVDNMKSYLKDGVYNVDPANKTFLDKLSDETYGRGLLAAFNAKLALTQAVTFAKDLFDDNKINKSVGTYTPGAAFAKAMAQPGNYPTNTHITYSVGAPPTVTQKANPQYAYTGPALAAKAAGALPDYSGFDTPSETNAANRPSPGAAAPYAGAAFGQAMANPNNSPYASQGAPYANPQFAYTGSALAAKAAGALPDWSGFDTPSETNAANRPSPGGAAAAVTNIGAVGYGGYKSEAAMAAAAAQAAQASSASKGWSSSGGVMGTEGGAKSGSGGKSSSGSYSGGGGGWTSSGGVAGTEGGAKSGSGGKSSSGSYSGGGGGWSSSGGVAGTEGGAKSGSGGKSSSGSYSGGGGGWSSSGGVAGTEGGAKSGSSSSSSSGKGSSSSKGGSSSSGGYSSGGYASADRGMGGKGIGSQPVLLDLAGNGLSVESLGSSSHFVDLKGDGQEHRAAWAGEGNGVLVFDADANGKISRSSEIVFTEWDKSETSDLRALKKVFDSNGNGQLDAGDARWADFKVAVGDELVSLDSLGIKSIDLTPTGSGQSFEDGSAITGTASYTKADGSKGLVGDATLAMDASGYTVKRSKLVLGDGSTSEDVRGYHKDGSLAFHHQIETSADGAHRQTRFDDDGNGSFDRSQTVDSSVLADGTRRRVVADFHASGALRGKTTTLTSADLRVVTTLIDQDGDGRDDQSQVFVTNADGSTSTTFKKLAANGAVLQQTETTSSADGLRKTIRLDETGSGSFNLQTSEVTVVAADASRTLTIERRSADGSLIGRTVTITSADGRTQTIEHDRTGNGQIDEREVSVTGTVADGSVVNTVTSYNGDGTLRSKTVATTSGDGLSHTLAEDLNSDGVADRQTSNVTVVAADGSSTQTVQQRSASGALLSSQVTSINADRSRTLVREDFDGDGADDQITDTQVAADGTSLVTVSNFNPNGSSVGLTSSSTSADGLTQTVREDLSGDGTIDAVTTDTTVLDTDGSRTQTVKQYSSGGAETGKLLGSISTTVSKDGLSKTVRTDVDGDGSADRIGTDITVLDSNGAQTQTVTTTSASGVRLDQQVITVSADRKTTTTVEDADGDGAADRQGVVVEHADGSSTKTLTHLAANGKVWQRETTRVSADGLTQSTELDLNGDGLVDEATHEQTVIHADGSRTTTTSTRRGATTTSTTVSTVSANGLVSTLSEDADGDGLAESRQTQVRVLHADGSSSVTTTDSSATGVTRHSRVETTSANGLSLTVQSDLDGDGSVDRVLTDVKRLNADGGSLRTIEERTSTGLLLSKTYISTSANGKEVHTSINSDGDPVFENGQLVELDDTGGMTKTEASFAADVTLLFIRETAVSADGLQSRVREDHNGDLQYEQTVTTVTQLHADGSRTETRTPTNADGSLEVGTTVKTISGNGLKLTEQIDLTGDGVADRTTTTETTLGADGSSTLTVQTQAANGSLLAKSVQTEGANGSTHTTVDENGDGAADRVEHTAVLADGSNSTSVAWMAQDGTVVERTTTEVSADGLTTITRLDLDGDGVIDEVTTDKTTLGLDGSRTSQLSRQAGSGKAQLLAQTTTSANGLHHTTDLYDRGWLASRTVEESTYQADGSVTTTTASFAGTHAVLVNKTSTTVSANGLVSTSQTDLDGDGDVDRTATHQAVHADGAVEDTLTVVNGAGAKVSGSVTTTSADKRLTTVSEDANGDGREDARVVTTVGADDSVSTATSTFANGQDASRAASSSVSKLSADGLTLTVATDSDGNGSTDRTSEQRTVEAADGSVTQSWSEFNAQGVLTEKTVVVTSADQLRKTTTWTVGEGKVAGTKQEVTTLAADGGASTTVSYTQGSGALRSKTTTTVSADAKTMSVSADIDGDGVLDQQLTRVRNADGSLTTTATELAADGVKAAARKVVVESANELDARIDYDTNGDGAVDHRVTATTLLGADGSMTTTTTRYSGTDQALERTVEHHSADAKTVTVSYDLDADGTTDQTQTRSTAFGAQAGYADAKTEIIENAVGSTVTSRYLSSTDADGQSTTRQWDTDGNGSIDQTLTDSLAVTDQGTVQTVVASVGASTIFEQTTHTSNDGKTVTTQHKEAGFDSKTHTHATAGLADGSTVVTEVFTNTSNGVVQKQVTTTHADGSEQTISRDIDGNGTADQTEQHTVFVDGSTQTVLTANNTKDKVITTTSADGLSSLVEWDRGLDGSIDKKRVIATSINADGSQASLATDYKLVAGAADVRVRVASNSTSADGRTQTHSIDTNGDGVFDELSTTVSDATGAALTTTTRNAEAQKAGNLVAGQVYWKQALAAKVITSVSSNGLSMVERSDYDGDGRMETTATSQVRIDGSMLTSYLETNASGGVTAQGTLTTSQDGLTRVLSKDSDNNGRTDHWEETKTFIDGTVVRSTKDYNADGTLKSSSAENVSSGEVTHRIVWDGAGVKTEEYLLNSNKTATLTTFVGTAVSGVLNLSKDGLATSAVLYDPANKQAWTRVEQSFNTAGQKTAEKQYMDDGTRIDVSFDAATGNATKSVGYDSVNRKTSEASYTNGVLATNVLYDAASKESWTRVEQTYNSAGKLTAEKQYMDDATRVEIGFDAATGKQTKSVVYDSANRKTSEASYTNGVIATNVLYDAASTQTWTRVEQTYNTAGQKTAEKQFKDDGSRIDLRFDPQNSYSWSSIETYYDAAGTKYFEYEKADNGSWKNTTYQTSTWRTEQYFYASGSMYQEDQYWADGTVGSTSYDVNDAFDWSIISGLYGANGALLYQATRMDNGMFYEYVPPAPPVILDLNGDQQIDLRLLNPETGDGEGPRFDWSGDGVGDATAWAGPQDGFLAIDLAADGSAGPDGFIDQARELAFASWVDPSTLSEDSDPVSDLDGLREVFDTNGDDVLDAHDARWTEFRVWRDLDQDGQTDAGELQTLEQAGVARIGLVSNAEGAVRHADGSETVGTSWFEAADGERQLVGDTSLAWSLSKTAGESAPAVSADTSVNALIAAMAAFGASSPGAVSQPPSQAGVGMAGLAAANPAYSGELAATANPMH